MPARSPSPASLLLSLFAAACVASGDTPRTAGADTAAGATAAAPADSAVAAGEVVAVEQPPKGPAKPAAKPAAAARPAEPAKPKYGPTGGLPDTVPGLWPVPGPAP